jgi:hypothetical protein
MSPKLSSQPITPTQPLALPLERNQHLSGKVVYLLLVRRMKCYLEFFAAGLSWPAFGVTDAP